VQLWRCASCKRIFTPSPAALLNKTYPIRLVLQALTLYNLGYSLSETAKRLKQKAGRTVSPSTIATWIGAHKEHTTFRRLRAEATTIYPPEQTIRSIKLYHRQVYAFAYHRSKLALLRRNPQHRRFEALAKFLENVPSTCPHELFRREDDPKARASQARPAFADPGRIVINRKENAATATAGLIMPAVGANKLRHETLQNFILANDSGTVAVEIPIWLTEDEIVELETRYGIELAAGGAPRSITGHLDFLQVRNDAVHILDYKPDARTNKPIAQLAIYALALTVRVPGLKLFDIKCAWFNEDEYNEFFPRMLFANRPK
jgi:hypothetical protein